MRPTFAIAFLTLALCSLPSLGCKAKPSEKACKDAIQNMRRITGQDMSDVGPDPAAIIRSCRGNSSKESVECMRTAKTLEDLKRCEGAAGEGFYREAEEERKKNQEKSAGKSEDERADKPASAPNSETPDTAPEAPALDAEELPAGNTGAQVQPKAVEEDSAEGSNDAAPGNP